MKLEKRAQEFGSSPEEEGERSLSEDDFATQEHVRAYWFWAFVLESNSDRECIRFYADSRCPVASTS
jgi:hypothetical protein